MKELEIHDRFSYKYRLLYCLILNYYRNYYADRKFRGKILVFGSSKKDLMKNYDDFYSTIKDLKVQDINTLKGFISTYDEQLKALFNLIEEKYISYETIISDIKREYIPSRAIYLQCSFREKDKKVSKDKNVVFAETSAADNMPQKNLYREIFIPEHYSMSWKNTHSAKTLCYTLRPYIREMLKTNEIIKSNNATETEFSTVSIFLNSYDGLDMEDELISLVKNDELDDEDE